MRLYEFDSSSQTPDDGSINVPGLWIDHPDNTSKETDISIEQFGEVLSKSIAYLQATNAIETARGYYEWGYSDDLAIDLQALTSAQHFIEQIEGELYNNMDRLRISRKEIAKIFTKIVDDPAWMRFIIFIENKLRAYSHRIATDLKNNWINAAPSKERKHPKLPAGRTEYSDKADNFIDSLKNFSENVKYNPKTTPILSVVLNAVQDIRAFVKDYTKVVVNPALKRLSIESPEVYSILQKYSIPHALNSYYDFNGMFGWQIRDGLDELEHHAKETLSK